MHEEVDVVTRRSTRRALDDVGRDRNRRSTDLRLKAETFFDRKASSGSIDSQDELVSHRKHLQFTVISAHVSDCSLEPEAWSPGEKGETRV